VSISTGGAQQTNASGPGDSISPDGRFVVFSSDGTSLVTGDGNAKSDVFLRDRLLGTTERVSINSLGQEGNDASDGGSVSADGRYVVFTSLANNLIANDNLAGAVNVFLRDRQSGSTTLVSQSTAGIQATGDCRYPMITPDGRYVVFSSFAINLLSVQDNNNTWDIIVRDLQNGTTVLVTLDYQGFQTTAQSLWGAISDNGRYVLFQSFAPFVVPNDNNNAPDVFVRDLVNGTNECVSVTPGGSVGNFGSGEFYDRIAGAISADGRYVVFDSSATDLVSGMSSGGLLLRDRQTGVTEMVSISTSGGGPNDVTVYPTLSQEGRFVSFYSAATNLVATAGLAEDCFVRDRQLGTTERVSLTTSGGLGNNTSGPPVMSRDGRYVLFMSLASNLVGSGVDTNGVLDMFVRDRGPISPGTDLCQPGVAGVMACPCSNPPVGSPRGCNNSSNTGGAQLTSTGLAWLAADTLVFVTNGEKPTAGSIVLQGTAAIPAGIGYYQGVRCLGGTIKRLYTKNAVGGSITAPGAGDPSVSAQSAAVGDTILSGQYRWYAVYYRDGTVLGGCPAADQANITQTQLVTWGP